MTVKTPTAKHDKPLRQINSNRKQKINEIEKNQRNGFEEGLVAEKILGATDAAGELMFLIKW